VTPFGASIALSRRPCWYQVSIFQVSEFSPHEASYEKSFLIFLLLIKLAAFGGQRLG
jgi:hypothetical protein